MRKKKSNKIVSLFIILALFFSVPRVCGAQDILLELVEYEGGVAEWTTDEAHSGSHSVEFIIPRNEKFHPCAFVKIYYGKPFSTLSTPSCYLSYTKSRPRFALYLDKTGNGEVDTVLLSDNLEDGSGEWIIGTGGLGWGWSECDENWGNYGRPWEDYEYWKSRYSNAIVLYIAVGLEQWAVELGHEEPLFVDDMIINGITYDLEPGKEVIPSAPEDTELTPSKSPEERANEKYWYVGGDIIKEITLKIYWENWEYDIKKTIDAKITWYLYDIGQNLVHTLSSQSYTQWSSGIFGVYIPKGEDGWIQLKTVDQNGNVEWWPSESDKMKLERPREEGSEDIEVTDDIVSDIEEVIQRYYRQENRYAFPPYLLGYDSISSNIAETLMRFSSFITNTELTQLYDEFYWAGVEFDALCLISLKKSRDYFKSGDSVLAEKYLEKYITYARLRDMSFDGALEIYNGNLNAAETLAQGIHDGSTKAIRYGSRFLNPSGAKIFSTIFLLTDFFVDYSTTGIDEAVKSALTKIMVLTIFENIEFNELGDNTISEWIKNREGKSLFPVICKLFKSEEMQWAISDVMKETTVFVTKEEAKNIIYNILDDVESKMNSQQIKVKCPVELCVYDSNDNITGLLNREVKIEIPRSLYNNGTVSIYNASYSYDYQVVGVEEGNYDLTITNIKFENSTIFNASRIPISLGSVHRYTIDWESLSEEKKGVTLKIDEDGDKIFERSIKSSSRLLPEELRPLWWRQNLGYVVLSICICILLIGIIMKKVLN